MSPIAWSAASAERGRQDHRGLLNAPLPLRYLADRSPCPQNGKTPLDLAVNDAMRRALREHAIAHPPKGAPRAVRRALSPFHAVRTARPRSCLAAGTEFCPLLSRPRIL